MNLNERNDSTKIYKYKLKRWVYNIYIENKKKILLMEKFVIFKI